MTTSENIIIDRNTPFDVLQQESEKVDPEVLFIIGVSHFFGDGIPEDKTEATEWFRKAAEQGLADAEYTLGQCYYYGVGVPEDTEEAVRWHEKAAEQGHEAAVEALRIIMNRLLHGRFRKRIFPKSFRILGFPMINGNNTLHLSNKHKQHFLLAVFYYQNVVFGIGKWDEIH